MTSEALFDVLEQQAFWDAIEIDLGSHVEISV
jgi:hypothetical protein